ncbi:hypothetical protein BH09VER1_BH09VER1_22420 [soil metagenome]
MRRALILSIFGACALLVGCVHNLPPPAGNRPGSLQFQAVGMPGVSVTTVSEGEDGYLLYRFEGRKKVQRRYSPTESQWSKFYSVLERLKVRNWKAEYTVRDNGGKAFASDGFAWSFEMTKDGMHLATKGDNAFPSAANPKVTLDDPEALFKGDLGRLGDLQSAVTELMKAN